MPSILVVEDVDYITEHLVEILTDGGFDVRTADDGTPALAMYAADPTDLVLLDLGLPVLDGWATLPRLLKLDPGARVIIHSGFISPGDRTRLLAAGARDTIIKKLDAEALLGTLRAALPTPI